MGLLDASDIKPPSKTRRYVITAVALVVVFTLGGWYFFRFARETHTIARFMDTVAVGNFEEGYRIWKARGSYTYQDFLGDWGTQGYYGPVQSYHVVSADEPKNASGVVVTVEVSPVKPFPSDRDSQSAKNRQVRLWVERGDQSISFPP